MNFVDYMMVLIYLGGALSLGFASWGMFLETKKEVWFTFSMGSLLFSMVTTFVLVLAAFIEDYQMLN